ncbi:hypothetical protein BS50DRAFT_484082 [Corynespora cassiicola Philippines]|uniref:Beta-xylosidase C-terminal Concanavalin A-like domain-containing protein n=1 Tax=Corynespora cassiicola Philippines TaxID=1448308 RepID=A0A2T2P346_CORCC|nr:hypothetical protein BS50DRAFT_484082 [Corynespora cassiicola Philippines]
MSSLVAYQNPIIPGFSPDPSVCHVDGVFYLVTSTFHMFPGLPIYASVDLKKWTHIATHKIMPLDTGFQMVGSGGLFAPTIRHHRGTFYIVCTNTTSIEPVELSNFIIWTTDIYSNNWSQPICVPFIGIDPSLFFDDDNRVYYQGCSMIEGRVGQPSCTITQFEIDVTSGQPLSESKEIWGGYARYDTEGPHIYKKDGWYYLVAAEGGTFENHMLSIARSRNIWGPYKSYENNPILTAKGKKTYIQNLGHGELFQDGNGNWWAVALGVRDEKTCQPLGRETFLTSVDWPKGGWPAIAQPEMAFEAVSANCTWSTTPPWKSPARVEDLFIRNVDFSKYNLPSAEVGEFTLFPSKNTLSTPTDTSTFIGRRQRSLDCTATASINLTATAAPAGSGIKAGLAVYKDHLRHASVAFVFGTGELEFHAVDRVSGLDETRRTPLLGPRGDLPVVQFRVLGSATEYRFLARLDVRGCEWIEAGVCETRRLAAREMTGPIFGVFAHGEEDGDGTCGVAFGDFGVENFS